MSIVEKIGLFFNYFEKKIKVWVKSIRVSGYGIIWRDIVKKYGANER